MNRDRSLEEIDIVKLLFFALLFIIMSIIMVFFFLVPSIKDYKVARLTNNDKIASLYKIEQVFNAESKKLADLKSQNAHALGAIFNPFDEVKFMAAMGRFFDNVKLAKIATSGDEFAAYELNVTGSLYSPQNFYNFIDFINSYENVIKIELPITMESEKRAIETSFWVKVFIDERNKAGLGEGINSHE